MHPLDAALEEGLPPGLWVGGAGISAGKHPVSLYPGGRIARAIGIRIGADLPVRPILRYGTATLTTPSLPIEDFGRDWRGLSDDMVATMYAAPGVGLAAPQIGVNVRLIVIDTSVGEKDGELIVMANPQILESDGRQSEEEGCLSVPGYSGVTRRPAWVKVRGQRLDGATFEMEGSGLLARAFAHEVDHLDGRLFLDRLGVLKRDLIVRKLRRRIRRGDW